MSCPIGQWPSRSYVYQVHQFLGSVKGPMFDHRREDSSGGSHIEAADTAVALGRLHSRNPRTGGRLFFRSAHPYEKKNGQCGCLARAATEALRWLYQACELI